MENNISEAIFKILDEANSISTSNPKEAYKLGEEAYQLSIENGLRLEEGYALISMSLACRAMSKLNKWLDYSFNALEIFEELKERKGQIRSLNLIGITYFYNSMYEDSLRYLLQALDLLEEYEDNFLLSRVLNNVGEVYRESGNYDSALGYYYRGLKISEEENYKINTASLLNNIGDIHFEQGIYEKAFECFMKSYDILANENNIVILGEVENKLGKVLFKQGHYDKSEEYFLSSIKRLESIDNKFYAIDALTNIGLLKAKQNSYDSFYYFEKAIGYAEELDARKKLSNIYKILADHYEKFGDFFYTLEYFKKYHLIEQEIAATIVGNKLEIIKIELSHYREDQKLEKANMVNQRLEMEIIKHRNELDNIKRINKNLEKEAMEDELTGIPNRRSINYNLDRKWAECLLNNHTISFFMIDIDNFKQYNDYWGHSKGDDCLVKIAQRLHEIQIKRGDIFGRYGGEEFVYCSKGLSYEQAIELGNLLKEEVEKLCIKYTLDVSSSAVTISIGGALGKVTDFGSISDMIEIADKELYKAKNMGRNTVFLKNLTQ